jgi:hypothetical protein
VRYNSHAPGVRRLDGAIGASAIDHDELVAKPKTVEAGADIGGLVLANYNGA